MTDLWTLVAAERGALADDVAGLTPEQWASRSLCPDWTVRDIVAHLTAAASTSPAAFLGQFAMAGFSFDKYAKAGLVRRLGTDTGATLAGFRAVQGSPRPPRPGRSRRGSVRSSSTPRTSASRSASRTPTTRRPPQGCCR